MLTPKGEKMLLCPLRNIIPFILAFGLLASVGAEEKPKGEFERLSALTSRLLRIRLDDHDRLFLEPDPKTGGPEDGRAAKAFKLFQNLLGPSSGAGSRADNPHRAACYYTSALHGSLTCTGTSIHVSLTELVKPFRSIEVLDDGNGFFQMTYRERSRVITFCQAPDGVMTFVDNENGKSLSTACPSFQTLYLFTHDRWENDLTPLLEGTGVSMPLLPGNPLILDAIMAKLHPAEVERIQALLKQLDNDDFQKREEASRLLSESYVRAKDILAKAAKDPANSPEVKERLERILQADHSRQDEADALVSSRKLTEDTRLLILLMKRVQGTDRAVVATTLKRLTGEDFGEDAKAWEQWRNSHP